MLEILLTVSTLTSVKLLIVWSIVNYVLNLLPLVFKVNCYIALLLFFTVEPSLLEWVNITQIPWCYQRSTTGKRTQATFILTLHKWHCYYFQPWHETLFLNALWSVHGTVQTFRRHLDRIDLSKFITYQQSACVACICCCILLFSFFFFFLLWGRYQCLSGPPYPVAYRFIVFVFVILYFGFLLINLIWFWFDFDLIWFDISISNLTMCTLANSY